MQYQNDPAAYAKQGLQKDKIIHIKLKKQTERCPQFFKKLSKYFKMWQDYMIPNKEII